MIVEFNYMKGTLAGWTTRMIYLFRTAITINCSIGCHIAQYM